MCRYTSKKKKKKSTKNLRKFALGRSALDKERNCCLNKIAAVYIRVSRIPCFCFSCAVRFRVSVGYKSSVHLPRRESTKLLTAKFLEIFIMRSKTNQFDNQATWKKIKHFQFYTLPRGCALHSHLLNFIVSVITRLELSHTLASETR